MKDEADKAKRKLIDDLNKMTVMEETAEEGHVNDEIDNPRVKKYTVSNPVKINGHIKYTIAGEDAEGNFEEVRRYREFFSLRSSLATRWPGIYIPSLPEKAIVVLKLFLK